MWVGLPIILIESMAGSDKVKVSVRPFVAIAVVLAAVLFGASGWNQVRMYDKLDKLRAHAQAIYVAHEEEIIALAKVGSWKDLEGINDAEKEARRVYVMRRKEGVGWEILCDGEFVRELGKVCEKVDLGPSTAEKVLKEVDMERATSLRGREVGNLVFGERSLFAFVPIKEKGQFLGWMVVKMHQAREF